MDQKFRILIVEDEKPILEGLTDLLVFHGYDVACEMNGSAGLERALAEDYDLVILDVMLPGCDGFAVCSKIREVKREQLVIMLTARTSEEDIILGLSSGADDYIAKPFSVRELVLRIEAVLRRSRKASTAGREIVVANGIRIDTRTLSGSAPLGETIAFTRREVDILLYLQQHSDRPVTRCELLDEVWGYKKASNIETRTVDIHIAKLRRKIEPEPKAPRFLVTTRGEGYQLFPARI